MESNASVTLEEGRKAYAAAMNQARAVRGRALQEGALALREAINDAKKQFKAVQADRAAKRATKAEKEWQKSVVLRNDLKEWLNAHGKHLPPPQLSKTVKQVIGKWFELVDDDGSRTLDASELKAALKAAQLPCGDDSISEMIRLMDRNRDGEISWDEFESFLSNEFAAGKALLAGEYMLPSGTALPFGAMISKMRRDKLIEDIMEGGSKRWRWMDLARNDEELKRELHIVEKAESEQVGMMRSTAAMLHNVSQTMQPAFRSGPSHQSSLPPAPSAAEATIDSLESSDLSPPRRPEGPSMQRIVTRTRTSRNLNEPDSPSHAADGKVDSTAVLAMVSRSTSEQPTASATSPQGHGMDHLNCTTTGCAPEGSAKARSPGTGTSADGQETSGGPEQDGSECGLDEEFGEIPGCIVAHMGDGAGSLEDLKELCKQLTTASWGPNISQIIQQTFQQQIRKMLDPGASFVDGGDDTSSTSTRTRSCPGAAAQGTQQQEAAGNLSLPGSSSSNQGLRQPSNASMLLGSAVAVVSTAASSSGAGHAVPSVTQDVDKEAEVAAWLTQQVARQLGSSQDGSTVQGANSLLQAGVGEVEVGTLQGQPAYSAVFWEWGVQTGGAGPNAAAVPHGELNSSESSAGAGAGVGPCAQAQAGAGVVGARPSIEGGAGVAAGAIESELLHRLHPAHPSCPLPPGVPPPARAAHGNFLQAHKTHAGHHQPHMLLRVPKPPVAAITLPSSIAMTNPRLLKTCTLEEVMAAKNPQLLASNISAAMRAAAGPELRKSFPGNVLQPSLSVAPVTGGGAAGGGSPYVVASTRAEGYEVVAVVPPQYVRQAQQRQAQLLQPKGRGMPAGPGYGADSSRPGPPGGQAASGRQARAVGPPGTELAVVGRRG